jgi:GTP cyclohydrolase IA
LENKSENVNIQPDYDLSEEEYDEQIGYEIQSSFPENNSEGHLLFDANDNLPLSKEERKKMIKKLDKKYAEIMDILRISLNDPNTTLTPHRIAKMLVNELFAGRFEPAPKVTVFPNRKKVNNLIISKGIEVMSICSHHWQPITGECAISYIPGDYVIGLSKLSRIVNWFSRRGQIQEELGEQIADYLEHLMHPKALGVVIKARHYCMIARGVRGSEDKSFMITSVMRGYLQTDSKLRNEFLKLLED